MKTMKELDNKIRNFAIDLHEKDFVDIIDANGDIYRLYLSNKEYEANDSIPPITIQDTGGIPRLYPTINWMRLNFD